MKNLYINILLFSALLVSCTKEEKNTVRVISQGNQENFQHFVLNVSSVQLNYETSEGKAFWYIMDFQEGMEDFARDDQWLLGSKNDLPDGRIKELRIVLKDSNYFVKDGVRETFENKGMDKIIAVDRPVAGENIDLNINISLEKSMIERSRKYYLSPEISVN